MVAENDAQDKKARCDHSEKKEKKKDEKKEKRKEKSKRKEIKK